MVARLAARAGLPRAPVLYLVPARGMNAFAVGSDTCAGGLHMVDIRNPRVPRFAGMHRFMATLVRYLGGKVVEQHVNHRQRYAGTAKYGIGNRMWKGLRDCFAMRWLRQRLLLHEVEEEY